MKIKLISSRVSTVVFAIFRGADPRVHGMWYGYLVALIFITNLCVFPGNPHAFLFLMPNVLSSFLVEINKLNQIYLGNERINKEIDCNECRHNSKLAKNKIE